MAATTPALRRVGQRLRSSRGREALAAYLFVSPWVIGFLLFILGPMIASFAASFSDYAVLHPEQTGWVGWANYQRALFEDPIFRQALKVTVSYSVLAVLADLVIGFLLALLLNVSFRGVTFFRTLYYMPAVISGVVVSLMFLWIFNPRFGLANYVLRLAGLPGLPWVYSPRWVLPSLVIMSLWGVGRSTLIYLASLQSIPTHLSEAAAIDGAGALQRLLRITLPLVTPAIFFNLVLGLIDRLQTFTEAFVVTQGGPDNASLFYVLYLYRNAFTYFKMGYAAALAWILFLITLALTLLIFRSATRWVYYQDEGRGG